MEQMNTGSEEIRILTVKDLGKTLKIGRDKAYALIRSNGFPSTCIGNRYIVTERALNEWLHQYEHKTYVM
ncbi:MAG: helix-turn-helix domain-containing protein [Lachnospiraceae bacterium]|nr:helix-turn-helix domain-containing protein [Lachnospiraceae bacterium]MBR3104693.1 helix-turn-helix domain-containing protein [Lachnospiraceae bacterium]MBR6158083.1 helix-turn-helix domain-containing protein [Lachnospiraceae bacterium]